MSQEHTTTAPDSSVCNPSFSSFQTRLYTGVVFLVVIGIALVIILLFEHFEIDEYHEATSEIADVSADALEQRLTRTVNDLLPVIKALQLGDDGLSTTAENLIQEHGEILGIQIAPAGVVSKSFGNLNTENSVLPSIDGFLEDYDYCTTTTEAAPINLTEIIGPYPNEINQSILTGLKPVYFYEDDSDEPCFWGYVAIYIDLSKIMGDTGLISLSKIGYNFKIVNEDDPASYTYTLGESIESSEWTENGYVSMVTLNILDNIWRFSVLRVSHETHIIDMSSHILMTLLTATVISFIANRLFTYMEQLHRANQQLSVEIVERQNAQNQLIDQERLRVELEKERELTEVKTRFMSTLSHELRTPLAIIGMSGQMLERYGERLTQDKRSEQVKRIQLQVAYLTRIMEEFSMVIRAEKGYVEFTPEPIDLALYCRKLVDEIQLTSGTDHTLMYHAMDDIGRVMVDRKLFHYLLSNLLGNAIKYSPEGSTILCELYGETDTVILCIHDKGIGIPEEDQKRLFEPYHRGGNVGTIRGTGLGLKIAKDCVDLHHGRITVQSKPDEGSTFCVYLPREQSQVEKASEQI